MLIHWLPSVFTLIMFPSFKTDENGLRFWELVFWVYDLVEFMV